MTDMSFELASQAIAARYVRRFQKMLDGQNVLDHAYKKVNRCTTIRLIAAGMTQKWDQDHVRFHKEQMTYWQ